MTSVYDLAYALRRLEDAIEFAELENDFVPLRKALYDLKQTLSAEYSHSHIIAHVGDKR